MTITSSSTRSWFSAPAILLLVAAVVALLGASRSVVSHTTRRFADGRWIVDGRSLQFGSVILGLVLLLAVFSCVLASAAYVRRSDRAALIFMIISAVAGVPVILPTVLVVIALVVAERIERKS